MRRNTVPWNTVPGSPSPKITPRCQACVVAPTSYFLIPLTLSTTSWYTRSSSTACTRLFVTIACHPTEPPTHSCATSLVLSLVLSLHNAKQESGLLHTHRVNLYGTMTADTQCRCQPGGVVVALIEQQFQHSQPPLSAMGGSIGTPGWSSLTEGGTASFTRTLMPFLT